jgi:hypothetical protein
MKSVNLKKLQQFEDLYALNNRQTIGEKLKIVGKLCELAKELGSIPGTNPLVGIDHDIERARLLNGLRRGS